MSDARYKKYAKANAANLNQAANTVLLTFTAAAPAVITGFGAVADSANGLLAAGILKLREVPQATGTAADITGETLTFAAVAARGFGYFKRASTRIEVEAGDEITLAVSTDSGAASTADVWIEYEDQSFVGSLIDNYTEKTA